ncbi:MAG: BCSC C-terminal domain-containing protein [Burkholderiales bacterium]|nr:BCSC C-terminal domain-containing protein [Burkholderiales bacterium]
MREATALDPAEPAAQAELARIHLAIKSAHAGRLRDRAKELHAQERITEAIAALEEALAHEPGNPWIVHDLARLYAARGDPARGEALFAQLRQRAPDDADVRYAMALFLSSIDREAEALSLLDGIAAAKRSEGMTRLQRRLWVSTQGREAAALARRGQGPESERIVASMHEAIGADVDVALEVARSFDRMERNADARAVLDRVAAQGGATAEQKEAIAELERSLVRRESAALLQASRIAQREGDIDRAVAYEQRALALEPSDEGWRLRRLASLTDRQLGWLGAGVDALHRSGSAGKSRMDAQEVSFGYREPWRRGGRAFFRIAAARVASGEVDPTEEAEASTFGSFLLCQRLCAGPPAWTQTGVAFAVGTQFEKLRLDIGASPIGFPVVNLVGGAFYKGELGAYSYSIDASRRPLESTLLSYAGSRDPNTGRTWGGVVTTGVRLNVSRDSGGDYGAWSLAGLYRLTGRNVKDNDKAELMAGAYRRLVNEEHRQLAAGVTTMLWRFSENAGEFTFGHGGYYSPKTYASLALPVTFAMRSARTSLYARASVSVSWSESRRAPFFPTDGDLQARAEALASANGRDPFYASGSNGRGYGRSFAAAAEHRLAPNLFVGARLELERSTNYTPNRVLIYIRMSPGGAAAGPIAMPPEPVVLPGFQY